MTDAASNLNFKALDHPIRVTEQSWPEETVPLVSITCITYNHVNFIRDAIEGFLIQETTFPVEIIIHDDASTDGTAEIVRDYEHKYPQLIKVIYQIENQYSRGNKPRNFFRSLLRGKYLALCEGDDYWTDPRKVEVQVSYLDKHSECVISGHDSVVVNAQGDVIKSSVVRSSGRDYSGEELKKGLAVLPSGTRLLRNLPFEPLYPSNACFQGGDLFQIVLLGNYGSSHFHNDITPSAYRIHDGGVWSGMDRREKRQTAANNMYFIYLYFLRQDDEQLASYWRKMWERRAISAISFSSICVELLYRFIFVDHFRDFLLSALGRSRIERLHLCQKKVIDVWRWFVQRK